MAEIIREYKVTAREFVIKTKDLDVICICGTHINGAYFAIPSLQICGELSSFGNISDNKDRIWDLFYDKRRNLSIPPQADRENLAEEIAEAINPYIIELKENPEEFFKSIMGVGGDHNG